MGRMLVVLLVLAALPATASEIVVEPSVISLDGVFVVRLVGVDGIGWITVINLDTRELIEVPLFQDGDDLVTPPIATRRPCGCAATGAGAAIGVERNQTLVIATALGGGRSTALHVEPRGRAPGEPFLAAYDVELPFRNGEAAAEIRTGIYVIKVDDAAYDTTCDRDQLRAYGHMDQMLFSITLEETGATRGRFAAFISVDVRPDGDELMVTVSDMEGTVLTSAPWEEGLSLALHYDDRSVQLPVELLPVGLSAAELAVPVGCTAELCILYPQRVDEVRWYVDGGESPATGECLELCAYDEREPAVLTALVRSGIRWGVAHATYEVVPRARVSFVDAVTGDVLGRTWARDSMMRVVLQHAYNDPSPTVWLGKLGPEPDLRELPLQRVDGEHGVFRSEPFRPVDIGAHPWDQLWVQYRDPACELSVYQIVEVR